MSLHGMGGQNMYGQAQEILVSQKMHKMHKSLPLNALADKSSSARRLTFRLSLPLLPYFVDARSKDSGQTT